MVGHENGALKINGKVRVSNNIWPCQLNIQEELECSLFGFYPWELDRCRRGEKNMVRLCVGVGWEPQKLRFNLLLLTAMYEMDFLKRINIRSLTLLSPY